MWAADVTFDLWQPCAAPDGGEMHCGRLLHTLDKRGGASLGSAAGVVCDWLKIMLEPDCNHGNQGGVHTSTCRSAQVWWQNQD